MIIDTSAIVAILLAEPERDQFAMVIATTEQNLISARIRSCRVIVQRREMG